MGPSDVTPSLSSSIFRNNIRRRQSAERKIPFTTLLRVCACVQQKSLLDTNDVRVCEHEGR